MSRKLKRLPSPLPVELETNVIASLMGLKTDGRRVRAICKSGELKASLSGGRNWVVYPKDLLTYWEDPDARRTEKQRVLRPWPIEELRRALRKKS